MISSAVAVNQIRAFEVSKDFIPLIRSESVLLSNLIDAVTNRLTGNEKIRKMAQVRVQKYFYKNPEKSRKIMKSLTNPL